MSSLRVGLCPRRRASLHPAIVAMLACLAGSASAAPPAAETVNLAGRVLDEKGQALAGVEIEAFAHKQRPTARSDAAGRFTLAIPEDHRGPLTLRAKTDDRRQQAFYQFEQLDPSPPTAKLVMRPARTLEIDVVDGQKRPVVGASVAAMTYWFDPMDSAASDDVGHAVLRIPADAPLQWVWAIKPEVGLDYFAFRRFDEPASNVYKLPPDHHLPLTLTLDGARTVTVRVIDEHDKPMAGVVVYPWYFQRPNKGSDLNVSSDKNFQATTDAQGRAAFRFIPPDNLGKITFWTHPDGYYAPERPMFDPQSKSSDVVARVVSLVNVRGSVSFADGRPAARAEVLANGDGYQFDRFRGSTRTAADGSFEIQVYPDQYCVFAADLDRLAAPPVTRKVLRGQPVDDVQLVLAPATRVYGRLTAGDDHQPIADAYLTLYQNFAEHYQALPQEERLPNPRGSNKAVSPLIGRNAKTDVNGQFEFFVPAGRYYIIGPRSVEAPKFAVTGQPELEVNLHAERVESTVLVGSAILESDPTKPVSEAIVTGVPGYVSAVADADGAFEVERAPVEMLMHARSKDGALAGIVRVGAGDRSCEILLAATSSARGRVVDAETGQPLADQQVTFGMRVDEPGGAFAYHFGGTSLTNARGEFVLEGLVPGRKYAVNLVLERDPEGNPRRFATQATPTPKRGEVVELGDFKLASPPRSPTVTGTVTVDGRLLAKGKVVFHPDQGDPVEAEVKDGKFSTAKVPLGQMPVTFDFEGVPNKYQSAKTTPLRVNIQQNKNDLAFDLKTE